MPFLNSDETAYPIFELNRTAVTYHTNLPAQKSVLTGRRQRSYFGDPGSALRLSRAG
jgi:hypothetical protein